MRVPFVINFCCLFTLIFGREQQEIKLAEVNNSVAKWTAGISSALWNISDTLTRRTDVMKSFENIELFTVNGHAVLEEIAKNIGLMMNNTTIAVQNIVRTAEQLNAQHTYSNCSKCDFRDSDNISDLDLTYEQHFKAEVNTTFSAVRVSPNVWGREEEVLNAISWSEGLESTFRENYKNDPTLSWQYFGSPKGFMRFFPAKSWSQEPYDMTYDFRIRSWFTEAMTAPKDVIILLDRSGSMTGHRRFLTKYIVNNILDTLYDNDFINIFTVSNSTEPLVKCFNYNLVQAHEENLRLLRESLDGYKDKYVGDITLGFKKAFQVLEVYREKRGAATKCNQVIMLITEAVDDFHKDLFNNYNRREDNYSPVRIFTYQLETEVAVAEVMEWIACANMGYYVNISATSEAHERTLKYLEVMSRPLNDLKVHNPVWSALYVHLADRRLSNWLWKKYEGNQQREAFLDGAYMRELLQKEQYLELKNADHEYKQYLIENKYEYTVTISMPVYNKTAGAVDVAGVAAIDVPRSFIKSLIAYYKIGVNGYAFIVTNNGYLILHPDHRTEFKGILKPTFNRVDLLEVEIVDDKTPPRSFNETVIQLRKDIVEQKSGYEVLPVKIHMDIMKRIILDRRHYFYRALGQFTIGIVFPDKYGFVKFRRIDEDSLHKKGMASMRHRGRLWKIHPEWHYCKLYKDGKNFESPEDELLYFIQSNQKFPSGLPKTHCDIELATSLLADFEATKWFDDLLIEDPKFSHILNRLSILTVFMSTHSGLTRWQDIQDDLHEDNHFSKRHKKAIDETWYKRAADLNYEEPNFVYSIPLRYKKDQDWRDITLTAANVIFKHKKNQYTPVSGVGYQMKLVEMHDLISLLLKGESKMKCGSELLDCYIVDNNGFILLSYDNKTMPGIFFGDVQPCILEDLVKTDVYERTHFYDYQAICYDPPVKKSIASRYFSLLCHVLEIIHWVVTTIFTLITSVLGSQDKHMKNKTKAYENMAIPKSVPTPCDRKMWLYTFGKNNHTYNYTADSWYFVAKRIKRSNLLFVAVNGLNARDGCTTLTPHPEKIDYNNSLPCYIATQNNYTRRSNIKCYSRTKKEQGINIEKKYCGGIGNFSGDI